MQLLSLCAAALATALLANAAPVDVLTPSRRLPILAGNLPTLTGRSDPAPAIWGKPANASNTPSAAHVKISDVERVED
ncbi:hypothetical protein PsYK624_015690 [Phanerochaete sordida]|uniref:Uncharacterized protein n=1 Tax=Phanerochaete sordida TaxID=48140 RepID=A0A9P3G034_9APHY|nr:hypothetical protein PsYK624_015690 [Phanerochaete sordida]